MTDRPKTPILDRVTLPSDMKALIAKAVASKAKED